MRMLQPIHVTSLTASFGPTLILCPNCVRSGFVLANATVDKIKTMKQVATATGNRCCKTRCGRYNIETSGLNPALKRDYGTSPAELVSVRFAPILYNEKFSRHIRTNQEA